MDKLKKYFEANSIKPTPWATANEIAPSVISRYLNGCGLSPANASKISNATNGEVSVLELLYPDQDLGDSAAA